MSRPARWLLPAAPEDAAGRLAKRLGIHNPAARILWRRGYQDEEAARCFLHPTLDDLHDPFLLNGMRVAVDRLRRAIAAGERILLYGDYDVDGTTSIVILKKALEYAGARASHYVPDRLKEGYGMRAEVIEQAARDQVRLIISVDTGIRATEVIRLAGALGIDVIVTDHHLPEAELPPAVAVLNPNRLDCSYPDKHLCGAAVTFKLAQALFGSLDWSEAYRQRLLASFLKIVAIATVADVVPLTGENRVIVSHGLAGLHEVRNPGLKALMDVAGFAEGERPTARQVGFRIAPRINAAGRMAYAGDVIELFLTKDAVRAREIADRLHAWNAERQQAEAGALRAIEEECARVPVTDRDAGLVFAGRGWHRGVVGIVASRLVERFCRPVFVLSIDEEVGEAHGSGRSVPGFHLLEALESMPDLFRRFGGHRQAAGVTMAAGRTDEFRARFGEYAAARLTPDDFRPRLEIDALLALDEVTDTAIEEILRLAPFGHGNPPPVCAILGVESDETPVVWKDKHLRVKVRQGQRALWLKGWNLAERAAEALPGAKLDIAVSFEEDAWSAARGGSNWAAVLCDLRPHAGRG